MGNKVANLLRRIVALEERFDLPPPLGDVAEQRRRRELISYATIPSLIPVLISS